MSNTPPSSGIPLGTQGISLALVGTTIPGCHGCGRQRHVYEALDLRVWANGDGSFKLTGLAGADLAEIVWDEEETRWQSGRTSTR